MRRFSTMVSIGLASLVSLASVRLDRSAAGSTSPNDHIGVTCGENCSDDEKAHLPGIVHRLNAVLASECFDREFRARKPDTELKIYRKEQQEVRTWWSGHQQAMVEVPMDTSLDQVVETMRTRAYVANLTFYDHPFHAGRACAKEGLDSTTDIPVKTYCYEQIRTSDGLKAGTIIHEISHKFGYKHYTDNDEDSLDSSHVNRTIPYSVQHAVEQCWDGGK